MDFVTINEQLSISGQITSVDLQHLHGKGIKTIIVNRPDGEGPDQPNFDEISRQAQALGIHTFYLPVKSGAVTDEEGTAFAELLKEQPSPIHAYCRTGMRSITLWTISQIQSGIPYQAIKESISHTGFDISGLESRFTHENQSAIAEQAPSYDVLIVGAGAAGIAAASSLLMREEKLKVGIIDPADVHYYQPGWTLVGAGIFDQKQTVRPMAGLIPKGVEWIRSAVAKFLPDENQVLLEGCRPMSYKQLIVAPGLKLNWDGIEGLTDTLGKNGVTSNYRFDLAPYTWSLVQQLKKGKAVFTQPPMPIKCAGAPQKAMYMSADYWHRHKLLKEIDVSFYNSGPVLFGVKEFVDPLMNYINRYNISLNFQNQLIRVDGENRVAYFKQLAEGSGDELLEVEFDMLHVSPPQQAPDFIRSSPLADENGWVDVDQHTLQHQRYKNIWSLGDVMNAPNAKTAAAARMQAPVVAHNLLAMLKNNMELSKYNGYGSCPLTVERGKIILAEFGYGGKLLPSFPSWLIKSTEPSRAAWFLKERLLPEIYWSAMLKGKEWLIEPIIEDIRTMENVHK